MRVARGAEQEINTGSSLGLRPTTRACSSIQEDLISSRRTAERNILALSKVNLSDKAELIWYHCTHSVRGICTWGDASDDEGGVVGL